MENTNNTKNTRLRLIEAAGILFAEHGFNKVTVRDIIAKANTHLSALNYHFNSKNELYKAVVLEACKVTITKAKDMEYLLNIDKIDALTLIVSETLKAYNERNENNWQYTLISREYWEPSKFFDEVANNYLIPEINFICEIIAKIANKSSDDYSVKFAALSLLGLEETFSFYKPLINAVAPGLEEHGKINNWLVNKIVSMTIHSAKE